MQVDVTDMGTFPMLGRSPGGGHGNSLQYSCLENPMDTGAWWLQRVGHNWSNSTCATLLFTCSVMSDSRRPHGLQHARLPCPSPSPGVSSTHVHWVDDASNHLVLYRPLPPCFLFFPAMGFFPVSQLFKSGGQRIGASASASVLPVNIQGWFPLRLTGLISLLSKGLSKGFSNTTVWRHQVFSSQPSLLSNTHIHIWLMEKPELWLDRTL